MRSLGFSKFRPPPPPYLMKPPPPPPPPPAAAAATTATSTALLGKYSLGRLLGRGSFAKVYQAHSLADGSSVAIKIIDKSTTMDAAMEPSIVREIAAMRRLHHHPNILKIHEVMATKSKIFLVMELATGGELFSKLSRRRRLSEQSARRYLQQLVSALIFCHENGVAHRDLKPQNLLLDKDGNLKVSDFGLSALPEQLKNGLLHTACGTPAYTAPEVACRRCGGYEGAKADAWSCGVILFVFLVGYLPFEDSNLLTMYKKIHRREYQVPDWVSKAARQVISQLLDPNPDTRLSLESLVKSSWFKKSLKPESQISFLENNSKMNLVSSMNAFDIISLSSGLDLSGLFESTNNKKEKRFTSTASFDAITGRVSEIGEKLGYRVEKGKSGVIGLGKGRWVLIVEVVEIAPPLLMVEVKVVEGGGVEFEEAQWGEFRSGLEEIVVDWHNDAM